MNQVRSLRGAGLPVFLWDRQYLANAVGHTSIDLLTSTVSLVLAILSVPLGLSNTAIGLIATAYTFANALGQPLFGWMSDRFGARWLSAAGALWIAAFFALAASSAGWHSLIFLIISAFGSAAFHPQGTVNARRVPFAQATTATAVFFLFGQMGSGFGPSIAGGLVDAWGQHGLLLLAGATALTGLWMWRNRPDAGQMQRHAASSARQAVLRMSATSLVFFALLLFARMTVQATTATFLPKYLQDHGWSPASYGLALSVTLIGGAIGNVVGGSLADRVGRRQVVVFSLFLIAPALWFYLEAPGLLFYILLFLGGVGATAGHSVNVVMAQAMLPGRQALASGLALGFMFASGAVGAAIAGWLSDAIGLGAVLQGMALVALAGGLFALALPGAVYQHDAV